jgi:hypothetical protein
MTAIIHQATIDKKRKKCGIPIESIDMKQVRIFLIQPSLHRISQ